MKLELDGGTREIFELRRDRERELGTPAIEVVFAEKEGLKQMHLVTSKKTTQPKLVAAISRVPLHTAVGFTSGDES